MEDVYPNSGRVVEGKLVAALIPHYPGSMVSSTGTRSVYLIEPKILHWEDRATEWSGKANRVKVSLPLYRSRNLDLVAGLVLRRNLFQDHCRIIEHSQFKIAARSKDVPLPVTTQGIEDSWTNTKSALVTTQITSRRYQP
jgi:hypothetical protein